MIILYASSYSVILFFYHHVTPLICRTCLSSFWLLFPCYSISLLWSYAVLLLPLNPLFLHLFFVQLWFIMLHHVISCKIMSFCRPLVMSHSHPYRHWYHLCCPVVLWFCYSGTFFSCFLYFHVIFQFFQVFSHVFFMFPLFFYYFHIFFRYSPAYDSWFERNNKR